MRHLIGISVMLISCAAPALADETTGIGFVVNLSERTLHVELPGTMQELLVEEGQFVEAGQVLARMRSHDLERRIIQMGRARAQSGIEMDVMPWRRMPLWTFS